MNYTKKEQQQLLYLARQTIKSFFDPSIKLKNRKIDNNPKFLEKRGTFITLTLNGDLRGCIGHILPIQKLYQDIMENAYSAAFQDPRFSPLQAEDLSKIKIEVSVLEIPKSLRYNDSDDLVEKLVKMKPGVILKKGIRQSTFLPQVWEEISGAEEFLSHLCLKAGLDINEWRDGKLGIEVYGVEKFSE